MPRTTTPRQHPRQSPLAQRLGCAAVRGLSLGGRGIIAAVCTIAAASITLTATSTYVYDPIATTFGLTGQQATALKAAPIVAMVLVVFLAGTLGDRVGQRRVIAWGSVAFTVGAAITAAAPVVAVAVLGLCVMSAGASTMVVVAVAILGASFESKKDRANAFSAFGTVGPVVYLVAPPIAGALLAVTTWRAIAVLWTVTGMAAFLLSARMLPKDEKEARPDRPSSELATPILAGLTLAFLVEVGLSPYLLLAAGLSFLALLWAHRRAAQPTLSFAPLRSGRARLLLLVVILIPVTSIWYTSFMAFQYLYGLTAFQISVVMLPAQVAGMLGARAMKPLIPRWGMRAAGLAVLALLALNQFAYLAIGADDLVPNVLLITVYGFCTAALTVVMSNSVMDAAPRDDSGAMSSYRSAAARVGGVIGTFLIGGVLFGTYDHAMDSADAGTSTPSIPAAGSTTPVEQAAMLDALHARALLGGGATIAAAAVLDFALRRRHEGDVADSLTVQR